MTNAVEMESRPSSELDTYATQAALLASGQLVMAVRTDSKGRACSLWQEGGRYLLGRVDTDAPTHSLDVSATSPERLAAHWQGFCAAQLYR